MNTSLIYIKEILIKVVKKYESPSLLSNQIKGGIYMSRMYMQTANGANYWFIEEGMQYVYPILFSSKGNHQKIRDTRYVGINSVLFDVATGNPIDISYYKYATINHTTNSHKDAKTFVIYNGRQNMAVTRANNLRELQDRYNDVVVAIGGRDFSTTPEATQNNFRSFIAYKGDKVYLGFALTPVTGSRLQNDLATLGFNTNNVVVLDGGRSTQMRGVYNGKVLVHDVPGVTRAVTGFVVTGEVVSG